MEEDVDNKRSVEVVQSVGNENVDSDEETVIEEMHQLQQRHNRTDSTIHTVLDFYQHVITAFTVFAQQCLSEQKITTNCSH